MLAVPLTEEERIAKEAFKKQVAKRLVAARLALGKTRQDWQQQYNIIPSRFSSWERGRGTPDIHILSRICDDHDISMDYLLRGKMRVPAGSAPIPEPVAEKPQRTRSTKAPSRSKRALEPVG